MELFEVELLTWESIRGWGQCLAAMVASQKINQDPELIVFGIVTNGQMWQFGQLKQDLFEQQELSVSQPDAFGCIEAIFSATENQVKQILQ